MESNISLQFINHKQSETFVKFSIVDYFHLLNLFFFLERLTKMKEKLKNITS